MNYKHLSHHVAASDPHPEATARRALFREWKKLNKLYRPRQPRVLTDIIVSCFVCPLPDFYPNPTARYDLENEIDRRWKNIVQEARAITSMLPQSNDWHVLLSLMADRLPTGAEGDAAGDKLIRLESLVAEVADAPDLPPRPYRVRPSHVRDLHERDMVQSMFWYSVNIEGEEPKISFAGSVPTSRIGILVDATITALGGSSKGLKRHMEEVKKDTRWRSPDFGFWDNIPRAAR